VARPDPHSYRDDTQPVVGHLRWEVRADFPARTLEAAAELRLRSGRTESRAAGVLDLDTRDLIITSVTADGADTAFELAQADPVMGSRLRIALPAATAAVRICYRTSSRSTALQWCTPEQTADGTHPFLYSQCQTIHARSMLPIQDTPAVRFSYEATLRVPAGLTALMSASSAGQGGDGFRFVQPRAIPAYLLALAVGRLEGREIGPRSTVWAEPSQLAAAAWEFAGVEQILAAAEELLGPYAWDRATCWCCRRATPTGGWRTRSWSSSPRR
jgi:leukotriene-A4 hydrolase